MDTVTISRSHRRQVFWQIVLPLILASGGLLLFAFFLVEGQGKPARVLADIAIIILLLPLLFLWLLGILTLGFAIRMLSRLLRAIPPYAHKVQEYAVRGQRAVQRVADISVKPLFWIKQGNAILEQTAKSLRWRKSIP